MTITLSLEKLAEIMALISSWLLNLTDTLHDLRSLLGKILYLAQWCPPPHPFTNRMLETLRACPSIGCTALLDDFINYLAWFHR